MDRNTEIKNLIIGMLFNDIALSQPLYCSQVQSEADGERLSPKLPLVYIWNEDLTTGACSISINTPIIAEALEHYITREDAEFIPLRDQIVETVRYLAITSIKNTCESLGVLPSVAFSSEIYLEMCANQ